MQVNTGLEIGKGCFPEPRGIGAGAHSLSWIPVQTWCFQTVDSEICEMSILPWSWKLAIWWYSPILKRMSYHAKSDSSSSENSFEFLQAKETPCSTPMQREERGNCCLCHNDRWYLCGKEARVDFWARRLWGWVLYTEVNVRINKDASNLLFSVVLAMAIMHCLFELAMCCFSPLVQTMHGHAQSVYPERRKRVWSEFNTMELTCTKQRLGKNEGAHW